MIDKKKLETCPYFNCADTIHETDESIAFHLSYGTRVAFVARVNVYDWRVYVDATSLEILILDSKTLWYRDHREAIPQILKTGTKLLEDHARCLFPALARWADEIGMPYGT